MKAMKSMSVNRVLGSLKRKPKDSMSNGSVDTGLDTPEANAARNVRMFCESGGPNSSQGEEVLYLPTIVESAESSPAAAKECAYTIRKFLSKEHLTKPYVQYNGIMLIRILSDNPGKSFTRNIDQKFVQTVKELLRVGRDPSVKQILMETLETFQRDKANDENLVPLIEMWKKEHERMVKVLGDQAPQPRTLNAPPFDPRSQSYFSRNHHNKKLPDPQELSTRIEEAKNSAQLLSQVVQSTPPSEVIENELVREFADRCQSASRSIQAYMIAENPAPDNDTMETLIDTNEQLTKALSQHQRAVLSARKAAGTHTPPVTGETVPRTDSGFAAPPSGPPPNHASKPLFPPRKKVATPIIPPPGDHAPPASDSSGSGGRSPNTNPNEKEKEKVKSAEVSARSSAANPPFPSDVVSPATSTFRDEKGMEPWHPGFRETSGRGRLGSGAGLVGGSGHDRDGDEEEDGPSPIESSGAGNVHGKMPMYRY